MLRGFRQTVAEFICPEIKEMRRNLEIRAERDALTGLANFSVLERALSTAEGDPETYVIMFDGDNFGQINKNLGKLTGDRVLRNEIAPAIVFAAEQYGLKQRVFRAGGDEFVVLAPKAIAEELALIAETYFGEIPYNEYGFVVSLSGGWGSTLAQADAMMQERKALRKSRIS